MKNFKRQFLLLFAIIFSLSGCTNQFNMKTWNEKKLMKVFTSSECNGRLTGTKGNLFAINTIEDVFESIGLKPYFEDGYFNQYDHIFFNPEKQIRELHLNHDVNTKQYEYGKDFLEKNYFDVLHLENEFTFDLYQENGDKYILVVDDNKKLNEFFEKNNCLPETKCIFLKTDIFRRYLPQEIKSDIPIVQISEKVYEDLKDNRDGKIIGDFTFKAEKIKANNIVGKINGKKSNEALILSAHFDHIGSIGDMVFKGSVDNASGICVLLKVAEKLKNNERENEIERDIIIVAFNGEESGCQGSKTFVKEIKNNYDKIINLNMDCLGVKDNKDFYISGDEELSKNIFEEFGEYLQLRDIDYEVLGQEVTSDHISFIEEGIPSISIGQHSEKVHTLEDDIDAVDFDVMSTIIDIVYEFIVEKQSELFSDDKFLKDSIYRESMSEEKIKINEMIEIEKEKLDFDKYKYVELNGEIHTIVKDKENFYDIDSLKKLYKDISVPNSYLGYDFYKAIVVDVFLPDVEKNDIEIGKEYIRQMSPQNMSSIYVYFKEKDIDKGILISISKSINDESSLREDFKEQDLDIDGQKYTILYDSQDKGITEIYSMIGKTKDGFPITMRIYRGDIGDIEDGKIRLPISDLYINNMEDVIDFIKSIKVEDWNILEL